MDWISKIFRGGGQGSDEVSHGQIFSYIRACFRLSLLFVNSTNFFSEAVTGSQHAPVTQARKLNSSTGTIFSAVSSVRSETNGGFGRFNRGDSLKALFTSWD